MIKELKDIEAQSIGYPDWETMENFIIDNNMPVVVAQLLVSAMDRVCERIITNLKTK